MEIFIRIPFEKKETNGNIISIGLADLKESFIYIKKDEPLIMHFSLAIAAINMILSALMIIGLPVVVTQLPIGLVLMLPVPAMISFGIIMVSCFAMMFLATLFSIQIMSYLQMIVPGTLIGKVKLLDYSLQSRY